MSFEYDVCDAKCFACAGDVVRALRADAELEVLVDTFVAGGAARAVSLRFRSNPVRQSWPQDVDVGFDAQGISIVVYSGTGTQRDALVALIQRALHSVGCDAQIAKA